MSVENFEELFREYPNVSPDTQRFREQLHIAIVDALPFLQRVRANLATTTLENGVPLDDAISAIDVVINNLAPHVPYTVTHVMADFKEPFHAAVKAYNAALTERRGVSMRTNRPTQEELNACMYALDTVLIGIIKWLESVFPVES